MGLVDFNAVTGVMQRKVKDAAARNIGAGLGVLLLGLMLVGISYGIIYWVLRLGVDWVLPLSPLLRHLVALALVGLLFIGNTVGSEDDFQEFSIPGPDGKSVPVRVPTAGVLVDTPETPFGVLRMIVVFLCIGPRTVSSAIKFFQKAGRLSKLDLMGCSAVITVLLSHDKRVAFDDIVRSVEGLDALRVLPQLGDIQGVLFLKKEPQGLSLSSDFRQEFARYGIVTSE